MLLDFAQLAAVALLVKVGRDLSEPLGVNHADFTHVLLAGLHKLVVDNPLRALVEQRTRGMYEDLLVVTEGLVALGWVFLGSMVEEPSTDSFPNLVVILHVQSPTGNDRQFESVQNGHQLLADVLRSL